MSNNMIQENSDRYRPDLTYSNAVPKEQIVSNIKIILSYVFMLFAWLAMVKLYRGFGTKIVVPIISGMWILGVITLKVVPEEKEATITGTKRGVLGYLGFLFIYRFMIRLASGMSSEQMSLAFDINIPAASAASISGLLQVMLYIISFMTPVGYAVYCGQKWFTYQGRESKRKAFDRIKGNRDNPRRF